MAHIIISTGDKGGAGKTMSARLVAEMLAGAGRGLKIIDCDHSNPDLLAAFLDRDYECFGFDVRDANETDNLFKTIVGADPETVFVVDMPAGAGEYLANEAEMFQLLSAEPGMSFDIIWTLNTQETGVRQLERLFKSFENIPARYTIAKNLFYAEDEAREDPFELWHGSAIRKKIAKSNTMFETTLPAIRSQLKMEVEGRSISDVINRKIPEVNIVDSMRWGGIMKEVEKGFDHLKHVPESA